MLCCKQYCNSVWRNGCYGSTIEPIIKLAVNNNASVLNDVIVQCVEDDVAIVASMLESADIVDRRDPKMIPDRNELKQLLLCDSNKLNQQVAQKILFEEVVRLNDCVKQFTQEWIKSDSGGEMRHVKEIALNKIKCIEKFIEDFHRN